MNMETGRCLFCYKNLGPEELDFHSGCSRKFFGTSKPPLLPYTEHQMLELGEQVIRSQSVVTGVQAKLSLHLEKIKNGELRQRFTIIGLWDNFILKPPAIQYPYLPELEDLTMHLAEISEIATVPHSLIRLANGSLAYITKRVDRPVTGKLHMEDMCQLTERLTEHKYKGSYEQIGKAILQFSMNPMLDLVNFFEQLVFSFLTGNADMHLKNFSLINRPGIGWTLCPAYDMVASALVVKGDHEELALNLNGKKRKITPDDIRAAMKNCHVPPKAIENVFKKFANIGDQWREMIFISFLPDPIKEDYIVLLETRLDRLFKDPGLRS
jgi:serine/threonine-protein kinase HipA